ncbi:hypothetical protein CGZ93_09345 [Enemella dayhoffiae]|uniref:Uncharacterized protein n=1 Tax=Enemella dayhoffiae TaxID=2016507 RepID=A0A255H2R9_9ACTN|nr:DUF6069 family protein [Enemella dayhoffiae]OYO22098.1 hypothetical protein CGZ93_09345 [Enemella dayhoffiae]
MTTSTIGNTKESRTAPRGLARAVLPAAGIALVANLIVYAAARALGVDLLVQPPTATTPEQVTAIPVAVMSVVPMLLALLLALAVRRWAPRSWLVLAWLGLAVGVVSMPVFAQATPATKVALSLMHLITGALWWLRVRAAARR